MKTIIFFDYLKMYILLTVFLISIKTINSQSEPSWMIEGLRATQYPSSIYITGSAQDGINRNETVAEVTERVKNIARANLSEGILASIKSVSDSYSQSIMVGDKESFKESFVSEIKVSTSLEINGIRVESYVKNNIIYGFAYANKYEIIGYFKSNLNMQVQQIKGFIITAKELEGNNEKSKAKTEFNKSLPIFEDIKNAQGVLSALDENITDEHLKMQTTMELYNDVVQANARLAQGIFIFINSDEALFDEKTSSLENHLKAILADNGCCFTPDEAIADWKINIVASSREHNYTNKIYFSYVDAEVKLFKASSDKQVYENEFTQKGGHLKSYRFAAKKAYDKISNPISEKILTWINN